MMEKMFTKSLERKEFDDTIKKWEDERKNNKNTKEFERKNTKGEKYHWIWGWSRQMKWWQFFLKSYSLFNEGIEGETSKG